MGSGVGSVRAGVGAGAGAGVGTRCFICSFGPVYCLSLYDTNIVI